MAKKITGKVQRVFKTDLGPSAVIDLLTPVLKGGVELKQVTMGGLKGFQMALQAAGLDELKVGDAVFIEATGKMPPAEEGQSPMVMFYVEVDRDGVMHRGRTEDAKAPFLNAAFWEAEENVASAR